MQINSSIIYSIWPPLFLIICFSFPWKALHEAHRTSLGIKAYSRCNLTFRFSRESWEVRQALLSRMDHTKKSKGFRSGLFEGQSSLLMNARMWAWIHRWVILEPCERAESCWKVQGAPLKCPWQQFTFQSVRDVPLAVQFHSWEHENKGRPSSCYDGRRNHNRG